jgi:hypothetical protein
MKRLFAQVLQHETEPNGFPQLIFVGNAAIFRLNMETIRFSERFFSMYESTWRRNPKEQTSLSSPAPLYWSVRNYYMKPVSCNLSPLSVTDLIFQSILLFLIRNYMGIIFAAGSMSLNKLLKCVKSLSTHENVEILYQVMISFQFSLSFFLWMLTKWITSFIQILFYHQLKKTVTSIFKTCR